MTTVSDLSTEQLIALYNKWATKPVKRFETRKIGEARLTKLLADDLDELPLDIALGSNELVAAWYAAKRAAAEVPHPTPEDYTEMGRCPEVVTEETETVAKTKKAAATPKPAKAKAAKVRKAPASIRTDGEREVLREGSMGAEVVRLLSRKNGATMAQLMDTTGWKAHTTRAYFVSLRRKGYPVTLAAKATYRITQEAA